MRAGPFLVPPARTGGGSAGRPRGCESWAPPEVLQLSEMGRIVHLKYGDCTTRARHIDASKPGIEHYDVRTLRHWEVGYRLVRVEVEDRQGVVALAGKERAMVLGVERHAMVRATSLDRILRQPRYRGGL